MSADSEAVDWAELDRLTIPLLNPKRLLCALCGKVAVGQAEINGARLCHGDAQSPTCYELALRR